MTARIHRPRPSERRTVTVFSPEDRRGAQQKAFADNVLLFSQCRKRIRLISIGLVHNFQKADVPNAHCGQFPDETEGLAERRVEGKHPGPCFAGRRAFGYIGKIMDGKQKGNSGMTSQRSRPSAVAGITLLAVMAGYASDWTGVSAVTDRILMLHFDDGFIRHFGYGQTPESGTKVYNSPLNVGSCGSPETYEITSPDDPDFASSRHPLKVGRKSKTKDVSRVCRWDGKACNNQHIQEHFIYLELPSAMKSGKTYTLHTGSLARNMNEQTFLFDVTRMPGEAIHVSNVGYTTSGPKFAYLSAWMGDLGPVELDDYAGAAFRVIQTGDSSVVFEGVIAKRRDLETASTQDGPDVGQKTYANADVWECDFSALTAPGEYIVAVERMGCSTPFRIGDDVYREVFYHAARGLYHNRTGIELTGGHTEWTRPKTPRDGTVFKYSSSRTMDWEGENGDPAEVRSKIIPDFHIEPWGWYQDAGDWDGYFSHLQVPLHLLTAYELAPEKFSDGELNLPESGNGIPDIVDEGAWLVQYFSRTKGPTGGVCGARIAPDFDETVPSPEGLKPSWEDPRFYLVSGEEPTLNFAFAGLACQLAFCYGLAGFPDRGAALVDSARKAYAWAEEHVLPGDDLKGTDLFAAAWLYKQTGETGFRDRFESEYASTPDDWQGRYWRWALIAYATTARSVDAAKKADAVRRISNIADREILVPSRNNSFRVGIDPYFPLFIGQATTPACFIAVAAYALTGRTEYLDAVRNTAAYYTGGNPLNMMWMSNFGHNYPKHLFHMDTWLRPDRNPEFFPGIIPYGPMDPKRDWMTNNGPHASGWAADRAYPDYSLWPGHELYFDNRYCPPTNEFTVHQNAAVGAAVYGSLCGISDGGFTENRRPVVEIVSPADGAEWRQGDDLEIRADAADNDDYVRCTEFFYDHHLIGRTAGDRVVWKNIPEGNFSLIAVAVDNRGRRSRPDSISVKVSKTSSRTDGLGGTPGGFGLLQNFPNPFNPYTVIRYRVPEKSEVHISVYDLSGKQVRRLAEGVQNPGLHMVAWKGLAENGEAVSSGIYFCRADASGPGRVFTDVIKMVLAR
jgi:hypothetical protein